MATIAAFWPVAHYDFLRLDDADYLTGNHWVRQGISFANLSWAFFAFHSDNWHPLTWLSHMLDCQLFGLNPGPHHLVNLLFHLANTILLFLILSRLTGELWRSAAVAALFALHPLHVESVAWVSERKDVLSALFWITTLWAYQRYAQRETLGRYVWVALFLALGLMAKPMLVSLPLVLLLLDWWPLGRARTQPWSRLVAEKIPLFALSAASCLITLQAQKGAMEILQMVPLGSRVANALVAYVQYLLKMLWPSGLTVLYPHPGTALPLWQAAGAGLLLAVISYLVYRAGPRRPYLVVGWLWYLITLIPVIGVVQVGMQSMADRYTYIPLIGIFIIISWGLKDLTAGWRHRKMALGLLAGAALAACLVLTSIQVGYWKDNLTVFERAKAVTADNYTVYAGLIEEYGRQGKYEEARAMFHRAVAVNPDYVFAYSTYGFLAAYLGRQEEAESLFLQALRLKPNFAEVYNSLGLVYGGQGKIPEAVSMFQKAIELKPYLAEAYNDLGKAYEIQGDPSGAMAVYRKAMEVRPDYALSYCNLGINLALQGKLVEAAAILEQALRAAPKSVEARNNLGTVYARMGKTEAAQAAFERALEIDPKYLDTYYNLALTYAEQGKVQEAVEIMRRARELNPNDPRGQIIMDSLGGE